MGPVPKKPQAPLALNNARGVLCEDVAPKSIGKVARSHAVGALVQIAGVAQCGSVPGGGTDLPASYIRHVLEWGRAAHTSVAILFTDIAAAFYSCLTEEAVGSILASSRRRPALLQLRFSEEEADAFDAGGRVVDAINARF